MKIPTQIKNYFTYWIYRFYYFLDEVFKFEMIFYNEKKWQLEDLYAYYNSMKYFSKLHNSINQKYDKKYPYNYHLKMVVGYVMQFSYLLEKFEKNLAIIGGFGYDSIEDVNGIGYNNLIKIYGNTIANIIYCCTNEKGKNRKERTNDKFYKELKQNELAVYVKLCDRIANMQYSKDNGGIMFSKYCIIWPQFKEKLYTEKFKDMFDFVDKMIKN